MTVTPYLNFDGRCAEAIEFYKSAAGGEVTRLMHFKDMPKSGPEGGTCTPGTENKVMHAAMKLGNSTILLSDGHCKGNPKFEGIALTLSVTSEAQAEKLFNAMVKGGAVTMPLTKTFFSPKFGMLQDKFGIGWMVIVEN